MRNKAFFCIIILFILVLSCSCNKAEETLNLDKQEISNTPVTTNIPTSTCLPTVTNIPEELDVIDSIDINKKGENVIHKDAVYNAETAQVIGDAVIKSVEGENYSNLKGIGVTYVKKQNYWIVFRTIGNIEPNIDSSGNTTVTVGYCVSCIIKASNGEILKVYRGE